MSFIFRQQKNTLAESMETTITFSSKEQMVSYLKMINTGEFKLEPLGMDDKTTGWYNEGYVVSDGKRIGAYGEISDVNDQQQIIAYLTNKLSEIATKYTGKFVAPVEALENAKLNIRR